MADSKKYSKEDQAARTRSAEVGRGKSTESAINVKNSMSSAKGPYQILDSTWKDMEKIAGKSLDRKNPEDNELAFQLYTSRSEKELEKNGLEVNPGNTYTLHVYGPKGGVDFLKKIKTNPDGLAIDGMSKEVINGNKPFFFDENGKPRTNISAYNKISSRVGGPDDPGAITLAKNIERQQIQEQQNQQRAEEEQQQIAAQQQAQQSPSQQQEEEQQQVTDPVEVDNQQMQAPQQPVEETSQLSRASNRAGVLYTGNRGSDNNFILPQEPIQEDIKTSGESVQKMKSFKYGGITSIKGKTKETEVKETKETKDSESRFRYVIDTQAGVTSGPKGTPGYYLYYGKKPGETGFNPKVHREFVNQAGYETYMKFPQGQEYRRRLAENKPQIIENFTHAYGGELSNDTSLSGDNDGLLNEFNEGGSHEENPNGGIFQGTARNGLPNTVEEGETKMGNYVFSNRLTLDKKDVENLYLPRETEGMTYSDASKFINDFLAENPFDYIIKRTVTGQLESLKVGNDRARRYKEQEEQLVVENEMQKEVAQNPMAEVEDVSSEEEMPSEIIEGQGAFGGYLQNRHFNGAVLDLDSNTIKKSGSSSPGAGAYVQAAAGAAAMGMDAFKNFNANDVHAADIEKVGVGGAMAKGAVSGAAAGMAFGPWGAAAGAVIGGGLGAIGAGRQNKASNMQDINKNIYAFNNASQEVEDESNTRISKYGGMQNKYALGSELKFKLSDYQKKDPRAEERSPLIQDYINNQTSFTGVPNKKEITTSPEINFRMKGSSPLQYAEGIGSLANYLSSRKERPRVIKSEGLTKHTTPKYYDESYLQTQLGKEANNVQQAAIATSGGSAANARAMTLAGMSNLNKLRGDSYFKMDEVNRGVYNADQAEIQRIQDANVGLRNQDYQANLQEEDYTRGRKELARDNIIKSIGNLGREQNDKNLIYNLTGGYNTDGTYDPEQKKGLWNMGMDYLRSERTNRSENGGLLSAYRKANTKSEQELAMEYLKKKYNGSI